ncbi:hypothetical protein BGZ47_010701 [Haplosporangium gracile]|nr:hypothetical protein BGZ47_010701 [Haplosporangium gracile]
MSSSTPTSPSPLPDTTTLSTPLPQQVTPPTASLSSLPPECLEHILAYHRSDLTLLHALLLVNRTFFQLTVPLLYQSPFLLIKASDRDRLPYEKFKRQVKLLWLLLCSVHHLVWVRQGLPPFAEEFPLLWNPAVEERQVLTLLGRSKRKGGMSVRFLTVDYLNYYTHHNHSSISDALPTLFPSMICCHMEQWSSSADMIRARATVERALLMHRPEGIVSLAVPITRVEAVQEAVAAAVAKKESSGAAVSGVGIGLRRLRRVEFYDIRQEFSVEDVLAFLNTLRRPPSFPSSSTAGTGAGTGTMLLTEIKIGGPSDYGQVRKQGLYTILQHLSSTLKVIDLIDWRGAVMDLDQIPTEAVEVLHLRLDRMVVDSTGPKVVEGWLKRAKRLRDLQICIGAGYEGLFRWAVERRRRRERDALLLQARREGEPSSSQQRDLVCRIDREERSPSSGDDDTDDSTGDVDDDDDDDDKEDDGEETYLTTRGRSPTGMSWVDQSNNKSNVYEDEGGLRKLRLAGETPTVLWGLLGATTAFCDRLEVLAASSWKQPPCAPAENPPAAEQGSSHGGQGQGHGHEHEHHDHGHTLAPSPATPRLYWSAMMTRLVHLDLKGEIASISFDMRSLAQAPYLQRLKLDTYKSDIEPALTRVPELLDSVSGTVCELELIGPWFVTDWDLERMGSVLPRLRRLRLSHCKTRLEGEKVVGTEEGGEEGEGEVEVSAVPRLPDYLLAAMPMQQDITSPSTPVSSRTRSHTSGQQQQQQESASTSSSRTRSSTTLHPSTSSSNSSPASAAPSSRYLSTRGLVHAVEHMTDLHYLHIGILISSKPPPLFGTGSSSSSSSSGAAGMSPWDMLTAASVGESKKATEKGKVEEGETDDESLLCLDEKSLLKAFGAQKGSESRAFPLEVEVQECRAF